MKKRLAYEAPEAELVLVRFEDNFLDSQLDDDQSDAGMSSYKPERW